MKKRDIIFGAAVIAICLVILAVRMFFQQEGATVIVEKDGEQYGVYPLNRDQEIAVGTGNRLIIQDGYAWMEEADCPDQVCVYMGKISKDGELIVCLPNRVVVYISDEASDDADTPDAVAG